VSLDFSVSKHEGQTDLVWPFRHSGHPGLHRVGKATHLTAG
jgi:hypothetical protein